MTQPAADIALLTEHRYEASVAAPDDWYLANILQDDQLLRDALQAHGLSAVRVDWARPDVDWTKFRCAVFRTTWDYFDRFDEFSAWLSRVEGETALCNSPSIIRWNMDKHYMADLEAKGIPIVACRFIERGSTAPLPESLDASGWTEAIIKPCVSGSARHTYRVNQANAAELDPVVQRLLAAESLILQPFVLSAAPRLWTRRHGAGQRGAAGGHGVGADRTGALASASSAGGEGLGRGDCAEHRSHVRVYSNGSRR